MFSKARPLDCPAAICLSSVWWRPLVSWFYFYYFCFFGTTWPAVWGVGLAKTEMAKNVHWEKGIAGEESKSYKRQITRVWLEFYTLFFSLQDPESFFRCLGYLFPVICLVDQTRKLQREKKLMNKSWILCDWNCFRSKNQQFGKTIQKLSFKTKIFRSYLTAQEWYSEPKSFLELNCSFPCCFFVYYGKSTSL